MGGNAVHRHPVLGEGPARDGRRIALNRRVGAALIALAGVCAWAVGAGAHDPITTHVTWAAEVGPILQAKCAGCHRPGGAAPMPLVTYDDARPWARAIKAQVLSGRMPRGQAVRGFGHVRAAAISPFEVSLITAWADGGAPRGRGAIAEPRGEVTAPPDVTVRLPPRTHAPAGERVRLESPAIQVRRETWISGWRFFPNDPAIVQATFALADGRHLGAWAPPEGLVRLPDDVGVPLFGGRIIVTVTYRSARLQQDFPVALPVLPPVLGLVTTRAAPARQFMTRDLPCEDGAVGVSGDLLALRPALDNGRGSIAVALAPPDAAPVPLLAVRDLDPDHAPSYWLQRPLAVTPDTRLLIDHDAHGCRLHASFTLAR